MLRRLTQVAAVALFVGLLLFAGPASAERPSAWLGLFFYTDPLILFVTMLAAREILPLFLPSLAVLVVTVVLGRVYCGWLCPFGAVHAIVGWIADRSYPRKKPDVWSRWQLAKYVVLFSLVCAAVFGVSWLMPLDPNVIFYRTTATALWPAAQGASESAVALIHESDPRLAEWRLTALTEPIHDAVREHVIGKPHQSFLGGGIIGAVFILAVTLNVWRRRFWCRYICPLGALFGLFAWRPWLRRAVADGACSECRICGITCHGAATDSGGRGWRPQECLGCLNCLETCPNGSVGVRLSWLGRPADRDRSIDLRRRHLLGAGLAGVAGATVLRLSPQARGAAFSPDLIRPPGAREERDFLARCTGCALCMKICPTGALQPTLAEAGIEGIWTPRLVPRLGYCDYECNSCGQACPTRAIQPLSLEEKKEVRIGLAMIDRSRCIPFALDRECLVCEEHCPVPDKAIFLKSVAVQMRDESMQTLRQPHVDPVQCIGCGICENVCPFRDTPAIRVTSAGETRHPDNQPMLA